MSCFPGPSLEPRMTWDGVATLVAGLVAFVGGLFAYFAVRRQTRHADEALQQQLNVEKQARDDDAKERRRAVATALLFEIDNFYKEYVRKFSESLAARGNNPVPPLVKPIGAERLAIYRGNASQLGSLPQEIVKVIIAWYGTAQAFIGSLTVYSQSYDAFMGAKSDFDLRRALGLLPEIKNNFLGMADITYFACGLLCRYTEIEFLSPTIAVVNDSTVSDAIGDALTNALKSYGASA